MKYMIVECEGSADILSKKVNTLMEDGWTLHGSVAIAWTVDQNGDFSNFYAQAMVKTDGGSSFVRASSQQEEIIKATVCPKCQVNHLIPAITQYGLQGLCPKCDFMEA